MLLEHGTCYMNGAMVPRRWGRFWACIRKLFLCRLEVCRIWVSVGVFVSHVRLSLDPSRY